MEVTGARICRNELFVCSCYCLRESLETCCPGDSTSRSSFHIPGSIANDCTNKVVQTRKAPCMCSHKYINNRVYSESFIVVLFFTK